MPIGAFAQCCGLTPSALRFYDDVDLLRPVRVDPATGYRFYDPAQAGRATVIRQLREIGIGLAQVRLILDADADAAAALIDAHVATVAEETAAVRRAAVSVKSMIGVAPGRPVARLRGPVLADAIEQVLAATVRDAAHPVLAGVRFEADGDVVTLTATDRYRLVTRSLVSGVDGDWAGVLGGDRLRELLPEIRRAASVQVEAVPAGLQLRAAEDVHAVDVLADEFPDHHAMLAALGEVTTACRCRRPRSCLRWSARTGRWSSWSSSGARSRSAPGGVGTARRFRAAATAPTCGSPSTSWCCTRPSARRWGRTSCWTCVARSGPRPSGPRTAGTSPVW